MGIELTITCNRSGAIELLEETGTQFGMLWQPMILAVSHAQRPPRQRLSSNAAVFRNRSTRKGFWVGQSPLMTRPKACSSEKLTIDSGRQSLAGARM